MTSPFATPTIQRRHLGNNENASPLTTPGKQLLPQQSPLRTVLRDVNINSAPHTPSRLGGGKSAFNSPAASCFMGDAIKPIPAPRARVQSKTLAPPNLDNKKHESSAFLPGTPPTAKKNYAAYQKSLGIIPLEKSTVLQSEAEAARIQYEADEAAAMAARMKYEAMKTGSSEVFDEENSFTQFFNQYHYLSTPPDSPQPLSRSLAQQEFNFPQFSTSPYALNNVANVVIAEIPDQVSNEVNSAVDQSRLGSTASKESSISSLSDDQLEMDSLSLSLSDNASLEADASLQEKPIPQPLQPEIRSIRDGKSSLLGKPFGPAAKTPEFFREVSQVSLPTRSRLSSTASTLSSVSSVSSNTSRKSRISLEVLSKARSTSADAEPVSQQSDFRSRLSSYHQLESYLAIKDEDTFERTPSCNSYNEAVTKRPIVVLDSSVESLEWNDEFSENTAPAAVKAEQRTQKQVHIREEANESFAISARADTSINISRVETLEEPSSEIAVKSSKPSRLTRAWNWFRGLFNRTIPVAVPKVSVEQVVRHPSQTKVIVTQSPVQYSGNIDREIEEKVLLGVGAFSSDRFSPLGLSGTNRESPASSTEMSAWRNASGLNFSLQDPANPLSDTAITHRMGWIDTQDLQGRVEGKSAVLFFFERPYGSDDSCKGTVFLQAPPNTHPSQFSAIARKYLFEQKKNVAFIYCPEHITSAAYQSIIRQSQVAVEPLLRDKPIDLSQVNFNKPIAKSSAS